MKNYVLFFILFCSLTTVFLFNNSCSGCYESIYVERTVSDTTVVKGQQINISTKNIFESVSGCDGGDIRQEAKVNEVEIIDSQIVDVSILNDSTVAIIGLKEGSSTVILFSSRSVVEATHFKVIVQ